MGCFRASKGCGGRDMGSLKIMLGWLMGCLILFWMLLLRPAASLVEDGSLQRVELAKVILREDVTSLGPLSREPALPLSAVRGSHAMSVPPAMQVSTGFRLERVIVSPVVVNFVPEQVVVADVTGDRLNDIVMTATTFGELVLRILRQREDGTLDAPQDYRFPIYSARGGSLETVDLDNDGLHEIVMGTESSIVVFRRLGDGFTSHSQAAPRRLLSLGAIDIDGDGHRDVFAQSWAEGAELYFSNGQGGFRHSQSLSTPLAGYNTLEVVDFTGDGFPDVVMTNGQGWSNVHVYPGVRSGGLGGRIDIALPNSQGRPPYGVSVADMDRDGKPDLIVPEQGNALNPAKGIHVHYRGEGNSLERYRFIPFQGMYERPGAVQVADIDGNGYPDIVAMINSNNQVAYVLQGPVGFNAPVVMYTSDDPRFNSFYLDNSFAIGDVNSDGCPDVVIAEASSSLRVFYGRSCSLPVRLMSGPLPPRLY